MQMQNPNHNLEIPTGMRDKLEDFRRRVWIVKLAEGAFAAVFGLLISYLLVFSLDRFGDTPNWLRSVILLAGTTGLAIWFPIKWHRWVWQTRQLEQVARILRHRYPRLGDQMLGIVELAKSEVEQERSEALCRAAMQQVDQETVKRDFSGAVPQPRHRQWAWAVAIPFGIILLAMIFAPSAGVNALTRWLMPWSATERYTFAQLDRLPNQLVVPLAEPFSLQASLSKTTAWSPQAGSARYGEQDPVHANLVAGEYDFQIAPQKQAEILTIAVGDAKKQVKVAPMTRPELINLTAWITLPDYLQYSSQLEKDARSGTLSVVKGSKAQLSGTATRELNSATLNGLAQTVQGTRLNSSPVTIEESTQQQLSWRDKLGLQAKQPFDLSFVAQEDEPPSVACGDLPRQKVMLESEVLAFDLEAADDFGIQSVGLEWSGIEDPLRNPQPSRGEKLLSAGAPESRSMLTSGTFSAKRLGIRPQSLRLRLYATDYLPDRERSYSATYIVHVLTDEEHAIWITNQLRQWFSQAQDVYEREQQLFETNQALRNLTREEIDRPEVRRRIESQASAEKGNARQLGALTSSGKQLITEAIKNDQFNVETLENWASMLNALEEIAGQRMPSVADLLQQAASAPGSPKAGQPASSTDTHPSASPKNGPKVGTNRDNRSQAGGKPQTNRNSPAVPTISDVESGSNELHQDKDQSNKAQPASQPRLTLPGTVVQGGGVKPETSPPPPVQQKVDEAIIQQENLLAEFSKVSKELQQILANLESSTFVKRLKAASRRQLEVAGDLNQSLTKSFGYNRLEVDQEVRDEADAIGERQIAQSENIYVIQEDLEAYFNRVQQGKYKTVIDEMRDSHVVNELADLADTVRINLNGQSIAQAEFWADALDRWAEQLVGPGSPNSGSTPGSKGGSLPPSIVLELMKILETEVSLRDETRAEEETRSALSTEAYTHRVLPLAQTQAELSTRLAQVLTSIKGLPDGITLFTKELTLLTRAEAVMKEATTLLLRPETGAPTIAAETEVIELLLQSKRVNPKSGGGSGSKPGRGKNGTTEQSALALLGAGTEKNATVVDRDVTQATGSFGTELPAEFRAGLDAYFGALETDLSD